MNEIEIIKPDDWHVHFRDGEIMRAVIPETTRLFARSIVMPFDTPYIKLKKAQEYKQKIEKIIPPKDNFKPYMTIYLTDQLVKMIYPMDLIIKIYLQLTVLQEPLQTLNQVLKILKQ